jgi:hypothetical protein
MTEEDELKDVADAFPYVVWQEKIDTIIKTGKVCLYPGYKNSDQQADIPDFSRCLPFLDKCNVLIFCELNRTLEQIRKHVIDDGRMIDKPFDILPENEIEKIFPGYKKSPPDWIPDSAKPKYDRFWAHLSKLSFNSKRRKTIWLLHLGIGGQVVWLHFLQPHGIEVSRIIIDLPSNDPISSPPIMAEPVLANAPTRQPAPKRPRKRLPVLPRPNPQHDSWAEPGQLLNNLLANRNETIGFINYFKNDFPDAITAYCEKAKALHGQPVWGFGSPRAVVLVKPDELAGPQFNEFRFWYSWYVTTLLSETVYTYYFAHHYAKWVTNFGAYPLPMVLDPGGWHCAHPFSLLKHGSSGPDEWQEVCSFITSVVPTILRDSDIEPVDFFTHLLEDRDFASNYENNLEPVLAEYLRTFRRNQ